MAAPVRLSGRARADLLEIWLYLAEDDAGTADDWVNKLQARMKILGMFPEAGQARPDIGPGARALVEAPYVILYRLERNAARVVRVLHGARNLPALFNEETRK